jgi:hypothetical protein
MEAYTIFNSSIERIKKECKTKLLHSFEDIYYQNGYNNLLESKQSIGFLLHHSPKFPKNIVTI